MVSFRGRKNSPFTDVNRSQQAVMMSVLRDMAEVSSRLEINRNVELQTVQNEIELGLGGVGSEQATLRMLRGWIQGPDSAYLSPQLVSLAKQIQRAREFQIEVSIMKGLSFREMNDRQVDIKEAHLETFEWIFSTPNSILSPTPFVRWLEQGDGIFLDIGQARIRQVHADEVSLWPFPYQQKLDSVGGNQNACSAMLLLLDCRYTFAKISNRIAQIVTMPDSAAMSFLDRGCIP